MGCHLRTDDALNWDHRIQKEWGVRVSTSIHGWRVHEYDVLSIVIARDMIFLFTYLLYAYACTYIHVLAMKSLKLCPVFKKNPPTQLQYKCSTIWSGFVGDCQPFLSDRHKTFLFFLSFLDYRRLVELQDPSSRLFEFAKHIKVMNSLSRFSEPPLPSIATILDQARLFDPVQERKDDNSADWIGSLQWAISIGNGDHWLRRVLGFLRRNRHIFWGAAVSTLETKKRKGPFCLWERGFRHMWAVFAMRGRGKWRGRFAKIVYWIKTDKL